MKTKSLIFLVAILICCYTDVFTQDYSKMIEIQTKLKELMIQMGKSKSQEEADRLQRQLDLLTAEMMIEAERLEKEILPMVEEIENSLPPILKKIHNLENKIDTLDDDLIANHEKINATSKEILELMGDLYLNEDEGTDTLTSFIVSLKFCKEITVNLRTKGRGSSPDHFELSYDIKVPLNAYWTTDYLVDVIQRKGYLLSYSIQTEEKKSSPEKIESINFSGWKLAVTSSGASIKAPIDKYEYESGLASVTLGPSENKPVEFSDPSTWPDEVVSLYMLGYTLPFVTFYSSQDAFENLFVLLPCGTNTGNLTYFTPEELNKGIGDGNYTKVITKDTFFPNCDESTVTISIDFPNLLCDQHANVGALATADACIDHGGYVLATEDNVFVNGKPVARVNDKVLCLRHGITEIVGDEDVEVYSDKQRVARVGDKTTCGAVIMGGSFSVYAGDKKK